MSIFSLRAICDKLHITGPQGEPGKTPVKGEDYWTEEDQKEIVSQVLAALIAEKKIILKDGTTVTLRVTGKKPACA